MIGGLFVNLVDDLLDLFLGSFLLEESEEIPAFGSIWGAVVSVLEVGDIFVFLGGDERVILRGNSFANALGKGQSDLLVKNANEEGLAGVLVGKGDIVNPVTVR